MRITQRDITVLIPTRNRPDSAFETVHYLRNTLGWNCPIVMVDQSDDAASVPARRFEISEFPGVRYMADAGRGANRARNKAAKEASTEWLLLLDDDVRPASGYLPALIGFIEENPWLDAVQGTTRPRTAWERYLRGEGEPEQNPAHVQYALDRSGVEWFTNSPWASYPTLAIGVGSGNLAIQRQAYFASGGFDERVIGPGEDREFGLRLWWLGYRCAVCPEAVAYHLHEASGGRRESGSRWALMFAPHPSPAWVYFHMKWFPGRPCLEMLAYYFLIGFRRPWTFPVKAIRVWRSVAAAKKLLRAGPIYLSEPVPREARQRKTVAG